MQPLTQCSRHSLSNHHVLTDFICGDRQSAVCVSPNHLYRSSSQEEEHMEIEQSATNIKTWVEYPNHEKSDSQGNTLPGNKRRTNDYVLVGDLLPIVKQYIDDHKNIGWQWGGINEHGRPNDGAKVGIHCSDKAQAIEEFKKIANMHNSISDVGLNCAHIYIHTGRHRLKNREILFGQYIIEFFKDSFTSLRMTSRGVARKNVHNEFTFFKLE